jgi:hypothetical protein
VPVVILQTDELLCEYSGISTYSWQTLLFTGCKQFILSELSPKQKISINDSNSFITTFSRIMLV